MGDGHQPSMTTEDIPSQREALLKAMLGASIARLTRYSWSPKETVVSEDGLEPHRVFSRAAGPLLITLDSELVIGAASQPSLISVTLWQEDPPRTASDPELYPVEADDPQFSDAEFARMLGKRIRSVSIVTREPENAKWESRPREVGVVLRFDGAADLILSHGLHDNSDDFAVLLHADVQPALWPRLHEAAVV